MEKNKGGRPRKHTTSKRYMVAIPEHLIEAAEWAKQHHGLSYLLARAVEDIWRAAGCPKPEHSVHEGT